MTEFNYVHFITFFIIFLLLVTGVYKSVQQEKSSLRNAMIFTTVLITLFLAVFSVFVVDKYTKAVEISNVNNKRLLSIEKIIYTGVVKNTGNFTVGQVVVEIKLVNQGHAKGNVKGGNFYKSTGVFAFLSEGVGIKKDKPQNVVKKFVVANKLRPGQSKKFKVYFDYPGYFRNVADFVSVKAH